MPTDIILEQHAPRSVLRHRPIAPDTLQTQVQTPRASRIKELSEPHTTGSSPSGTVTSKAKGTWLITLVFGMLITMVLLWLGQAVCNWGQQVSDDLRYGRPRTTNIDHVVGHETSSTPTHFTALNLKGQIYIIELPGGQANHSHILVGPHLYGPNSDLAPITLSFIGDTHHPDLLVSVQNIQIHFHNTGTSFVPDEP